MRNCLFYHFLGKIHEEMLMTASPQSSYMIWKHLHKKFGPETQILPIFWKSTTLAYTVTIYSIKKVWGPKLCVSLTLCPNPSVYNVIDICSSEKSNDNAHSFQHIGDNSRYHKATLKNCLSCDPPKKLNLAKYSHQLQRAHSKYLQNVFQWWY